jgi:hypothetical protein
MPTPVPRLFGAGSGARRRYREFRASRKVVVPTYVMAVDVDQRDVVDAW